MPWWQYMCQRRSRSSQPRSWYAVAPKDCRLLFICNKKRAKQLRNGTQGILKLIHMQPSLLLNSGCVYWLSSLSRVWVFSHQTFFLKMNNFLGFLLITRLIRSEGVLSWSHHVGIGSVHHSQCFNNGHGNKRRPVPLIISVFLVFVLWSSWCVCVCRVDCVVTKRASHTLVLRTFR